MSIQIVQENIVNMKVDAIVNAANDALWQGGGVCGAIFRAAGSQQLTIACQEYGGCPTGKAVITPGFCLDAKYIIHAVGPIYDARQVKRMKSLLSSAYTSSLNLCIEHNIHTISFPLISAGIYGYPMQDAWKVAIDACNTWLKENSAYSLDIFFAVLDSHILEVGMTELSKI